MDNHPAAATAAAVECVQVLIEKNKEWINRYGMEMNFRTGIHTGEVIFYLLYICFENESRLLLFN